MRCPAGRVMPTIDSDVSSENGHTASRPFQGVFLMTTANRGGGRFVAEGTSIAVQGPAPSAGLEAPGKSRRRTARPVAEAS